MGWGDLGGGQAFQTDHGPFGPSRSLWKIRESLVEPLRWAGGVEGEFERAAPSKRTMVRLDFFGLFEGPVVWIHDRAATQPRRSHSPPMLDQFGFYILSRILGDPTPPM